jgi:cell division protein FtsX
MMSSFPFLRFSLMNMLMVMTLAAVMIVPELVYIFNQSSQQPLQELRQNARMTVFLNLDTSPNERQAFNQQLQRIPEIQSLQLLTRQQVSEKFRDESGLGALLGHLDDPLPATAYIELKPNIPASRIEAIVKSVQTFPGVDLALHDRQWESKLLHFINMTAGLFWFAVSLLGMVFIMVVVFATRVANEAERDYLNLQLTFGATHHTIIRQFAMANLQIGALAGLLSVLLTTIIAWWLNQYIPEFWLQAGWTLQLLGFGDALIAIVLGGLCAFITSWISCGLYLLRLENALRLGNL